VKDTGTTPLEGQEAAVDIDDSFQNVFLVGRIFHKSFPHNRSWLLVILTLFPVSFQQAFSRYGFLFESCCTVFVMVQ
jgi:hypothetical protein